MLLIKNELKILNGKTKNEIKQFIVIDDITQMSEGPLFWWDFEKLPSAAEGKKFWIRSGI